MARSYFLAVVLIVLAFAQGSFAWVNRDVRPNWEVLEPPPAGETLQIASFGDAQFLYRILAMQLQNAGDEGGRITPIRAFDINMVVAWLDVLDTLDARADHHVGLALRYFSLHQDKASLEPLVRYAMRHVDKNPALKLNWLSQALLIAELRLKDDSLALEVADQMGRYELPQIKTAAFLIAPLMREKQGDHAGALLGLKRALRIAQDRQEDFEAASILALITSLESRPEPGREP
jgi:hypothetical protein